MTNNDEKFQQRWEFRRGGVDGDTSSDDSKSNSNGDPTDKKYKPVTDLVLLENDETVDTPEGQRHDKIDTYNIVKPHTVEADEKKIEKSSKKRNVVKKKKKKKPNGCLVKENERKRNLKAKEMVDLKDLKTFSDSLIHQLTVDRENMFAHMREEMGKLVASGLNLKPIKKNVRCSQKNKARPRNGTKAGVKLQKCNGGSMDKNVVSNEVLKNDKVLEPTSRNELPKSDNRSRLSTMPQTNLANGSDQVVSSSYLTLPTVLPKPQLQNLRNHIPSELPMNNNEKRIYHRPAEFKLEERSGSFSNIYHRSIGLLGQNCSHTASLAVGFPIPLNQGMNSGLNISSLTYCDNSFVDNNKVGPRMNGGVVRIPGAIPASSERVFANGISTFVAHKADGEFVKDGQFYRASLRKEH